MLCHEKSLGIRGTILTIRARSRSLNSSDSAIFHFAKLTKSEPSKLEMPLIGRTPTLPLDKNSLRLDILVETNVISIHT